jgi:hypothetical protein
VVKPIPIDLGDFDELIYLESGTQPYCDWIQPINELNYTDHQHFIWAHWIMVF